uniref:Uncharacterized protein n=1 Tax=uncultured prokaryote TaxID=198431 RepID=A0A0H5Q7W0_9ZZZZ|nr:hypothetical protein [uncultured prokaryote]
MAEMREVLTTWTSTNSKVGTSVMYFDPEMASAEDCRQALFLAWSTLKVDLTGGTSFSVATEGRLIEASTGTLTGAWSAGTPATVPGTGTGSPVPNASMLLVRSETGIIRNGHRVRGRTFIPGLSTNFTSGGEITTGVQTLVNNAFDLDFILAAAPVVWSRPGPKGPGLAVPVVSYSAWRELAVLRRRR